MMRLRVLIPFSLSCLVLLPGLAGAEGEVPASEATVAVFDADAGTGDAVAPATVVPIEVKPVEAAAPVAPDEAGLEALLSEQVGSAASRTAESSSEAPATTWSISGTDLKRYGIQSIEEAIRFLGHGMTSYEYDERLNAAFGGRGYMSDNIGLHLAILIDGNQSGGSAKTARGTMPYMVPIELVDHLEIVLGPGSVIYGNSAMLGVVNVITRSAASLEGNSVVAQAGAGLPGDAWAKDLSWGEVWGRAAAYGGTRLQLGSDPFDLAWHFATRWDRQQGRSQWFNVPGTDSFGDPATSWSHTNVFNRELHTRLYGRASWGRWTFMSSVAVAWATGTGPIDAAAGSSTFEPEYMLDAQWSKHVGDRGDLSLRLYGVVFDSSAKLVPHTQDEAKCLATVGVSPCFDTLHYINFRPFLEPVLTWDWALDRSHVTTFGAQVFIDGSVITQGVSTSDEKKAQLDEPIVAPLPNAAAYVQHVWRASFGTFNVGVRGDVGYRGDTAPMENAVSPRFTFSRGVWKDGTAKLILSTGFRTATITERFLEIDGFLVKNLGIKPERVRSAELNLAQRLGPQNLQLSVFIAGWDGLIATHKVDADGVRVNQFANVKNLLAAGVNVGWRGTSGPVDWSVSANYAPGRTKLPADITSWTDEELLASRLQRTAVEQFGVKAFGWFLMPSEGMPDFYSTAHASYSFGEGRPRVSLAASVSSPRVRVGYANDTEMLDPRNVEGAWLPWSADVRGAVEAKVSDAVGVRLVVTWRSLSTVASAPRVGNSTGPLPSGKLGDASNPVAPLSAMLELSVRL